MEGKDKTYTVGHAEVRDAAVRGLEPDEPVETAGEADRGANVGAEAEGAAFHGEEGGFACLGVSL
jgi:hypothetical protein